MKIFGICLVKNEEDIVAYCLERHTEWADMVFVYDNGSTDSTWKIVLDEAKKNPKVVPFKSEAKPFKDSLRAEVFNAYRHLAKDGDWWCVRCDSDEFYLDDPRVFLHKVSNWYQVVLSLHYEYQLCEEDLLEDDFDQLPAATIINKLKYYSRKVTSETRFIKHRTGLVWFEEETYPRHKGVSYPGKIRIQHYQYRAPKQIQKRIEVRRQARKDGHKYFGKDMVDNWYELVPNRASCIRESKEMRYEYIKDPNVEPKLNRWLKMVLHALKIFP